MKLFVFKSIFINSFISLICFEFTLSAELKDEFKSFLINSLFENFIHSNLKINNTDLLKQNLKAFQIDLMRKRNIKCINNQDQESNLSLLKFHNLNFTDKKDQFTNLISSFSNLSFNSKEFYDFAIKINNEFYRKCFDAESLINLFANTNNRQDFENVFKFLLTQLTNEGCDVCNKKNENKTTVSRLETWGYGILFVSLITTSSLCGAFVIPFSKKKIYKKILMFLIAIAVGSLAGSGFLHLIPQAYGITEDEKYSGNHAYVWKSLVMMGGVYLFYLVERIMKIMILRKKMFRKNSSPIDFKIKKNENQIILESIGYLKPHEPKLEPNIEMRIHVSEEALSHRNEKKNNHGHSHGFEDLNSVAPVAWMIIFGDGLHNFIDGLSIGAAFTESVFKGISICIAVICEEFPHELGDFAILINAGMSYPVALLFNFLSACCCFIGLAVGITLGENLGANQWIYAMAGGMFLYISLCGMIPELNEMGEEIERDYINQINSNNAEEEKNFKLLETNNNNIITKDSILSNDKIENFNFKLKIKILIIQNIGILFGFLFMLFMAIYSELIIL